jgi:predicted DNA-binding protein
MKKTLKKEKVVQTSLRLPVDLWERIRMAAYMQRLSMSQAIVVAIEEYCERDEKSGRRGKKGGK